MSCQVELHDDETSFATSVSGFLETHEAENAMFLGQLAAARQGPRTTSPLMARATMDGETVFAAFHRDFTLIVSRGPDAAIDATIAALGARRLELPGVLGPAREAERFAVGWAATRGCGHRLAVSQRIYQLTEVRWPGSVPGSLRPLSPADLELATGWAQDFDHEALPRDEWRTPERARQVIGARIDAGNLFAWEVENHPVAMAGLTRPTARTISVNSVYTPPARRRRGFASALVAAISQVGLSRGKQACVLYTDLANPTSNSIYPKIGYRPVCDSRHYSFRPL
jgi:uncharacterized protein